MITNEVTKFRIEKQRLKMEYMSPKSETHLTHSQNNQPQYNIQDIKRPLKTNHQDLSFKGLSLAYKTLGTYSKKEFFEFADKYIGKTARNLFDDLTNKHYDRVKKLIQIDPENPDKFILREKTILHLAWNNAIYIIKILPGDILNGLVELLGKFPGLKNWSEKTLKTPFFKNIRQRSKIEAKMNSLTGMIRYRELKLENAAKKLGKKVQDLSAEEIKNVDSKLESNIFQNKLKQFDPKSGNYDTKHERALNRLVSGLPPAVFLATDAYNLSRMMDDDHKAADKERKIRFKQEVSRILTSGFLTLVTMGAFQKFINKSKMGIVLTTGITVLVTEMFSRLSNGKHIKRLTPEEAREENKKLNAPEAKIQPITFKADETNAQKNPANKPKEQQKPLLSFDTLMKGSALVLATGYGIKGFKNLPFVRKAALKYFEHLKKTDLEKYNKLEIAKEFSEMKEALLKQNKTKYEKYTDEQFNQKNAVKLFEKKILYRPFTDLYKKMTKQKFLVKEELFDEVIGRLEEVDKKLADQYKSIGKEKIEIINGKKFINLGMQDYKINLWKKKNSDDYKKLNIKPLVDFVIAPFKFIWNTITLPYWMVNEKIMQVIKGAKPKETKDIDALANSFDRIVRYAHNKKMSANDFKNWMEININKGFNTDSLSSISNAELSNLAKTAASIATIWFLMTDNYNMVMLKSNGNDKEGAQTKFKERFVQEGSRLFYQTLLIDLFNSTFRNQYNSSLFGMSWITLIDTTLGEMLTRSSVGTPIKAHSRDELIELETRQNNYTGFKKGYFNFMQRLTGKRSIKSYEVAPKNKPETATQPQTISTNSNTLEKDILFAQNNILHKMIKEG